MMRFLAPANQGFLPPYILERLAQAAEEALRKAAFEAIGMSASLRALRTALSAMPIMAAIPSPAKGRERLIYDMGGESFPLPGRLLIREGASPLPRDTAGREAYRHLGATYDFFKALFDRDSLDDNGMALLASVHYGRRYTNAFWNGEQMVFGDGDGKLFRRFTRSLDVVAHELTHGVIAHAANLEYYGQPGALNEHFADVFGLLVKQRRLGQTAASANWLIGAEIMGPRTKVKAIRTFKAEKAYANDPIFGSDPQPKRMRDYDDGPDDNGGVHINSGIPNHAFYLAALAIGGRAWETLGPVWYRTLGRLGRRADFAAAAETSCEVAAALHGPKSPQAAAVKAAWKAVGISPARPKRLKKES
ncbi:MAG: M4 family metallopeptidase [Candidatus Aminicenantes bacterium]|nr:M4 family metallopeptidase [Candidatus Aminicenantes bacterium]